MKKLLILLLLSFSPPVFADGCVSGDCVNGYGTYVWNNGNKYVGENKNNASHGQGTFTYADGSKYVGGYKNDLRHGQGTYTHPDGDKYVGGYKDGNLHGQGTYTYPSGNKYCGEYKNGQEEGLGAFIFRNTDKYIGEFKNGFRNGQGTFSSDDGTNETGIWKKGKLITPNNIQTSFEIKNCSNNFKEALDGYLENEELKSAIDDSEYENSGSVKKLNENQNETDVYEGERKFSISWEGYKSTIGTLTFSSIQNTGSVNFILPANIKCTGTYALSELKGTWSILCNNDMSSTGSLKWNSSDDSVVGKGRDNENRSVEFFVEGY